MAEVITELSNFILEIHSSTIGMLPSWVQGLINLFVLVLLVVIYSIIVWHGYRLISKKDPLGLNLTQYNKAENSFYLKLITSGLYLLEYIIIIPFIIFGAFSVFTIMLIFLNEGLTVAGIILISAVMIAAIRATAYYKEDLAKDLAKMFPLMILAISILNPRFFQIERIFLTFQEIPLLINNIGIYLIFIIGFEIILRFFDFIFSLFGMEEVDETTE
jgi:hypothetical protein